MGEGEWIDLAGLITPKKAVDLCWLTLNQAKLRLIEKLTETFREMQKSYYDWEWTWSCERIEEEEAKPVYKLTAKDIIRIVEQWKKSVVELDSLLYEDARKEFNCLR